MACKICTHSKRSEIDAALIQSESLRSVAKRFAVSEGSVFRHGKKHVAATIAVAKQAKNIEIGEGLISEVRSLHARALGILAKAEAAGHLDVALRAIRELRGILELLGKLDGQLQERGGTQQIQVVYVDKQQVILSAPNVHPPKCISDIDNRDFDEKSLSAPQQIVEAT